MKKLLFAAATLDIGGIETALVTLINYLAEEKNKNEYKYEITLVLEHKQGLFLDEINNRVKIIEYAPSNIKLILLRKFINLIKQVNFSYKYKNKFDFSASYATYSLPDSFMARTASKNSALWCHMDYLAQFNGRKQSVKTYFLKRHVSEFKHIIFVSGRSRSTFLEAFPELKEQSLYINNLINYKAIIDKSKEKLDEQDLLLLDKKVPTFLNVGRHEENQKKLSRIIKATKKLKNAKIPVRVLLVGDGPDTEKYKKMVKEYKVEDEILFLGRKKNPYPYYNISDCLIISSSYEGFPVVYIESLILNKPVITTDVAGSEIIFKKYGYVEREDSDDIRDAMKNFIEHGYEIKERFNAEEYNKEIIDALEKII